MENKPQPEQSETPRTDAEYARYPVLDTQRGGDAVLIQFARQLERELTAANARIAELEGKPKEQIETAIERIAKNWFSAWCSKFSGGLTELLKGALTELSAIHAADHAKLEAEVARLKSSRQISRDQLDEASKEIGTLKDQCASLRAQLAEKSAELETLPADWFVDASLETWFPMTAETLQSAKDAHAELLNRYERVQDELVAVRDGLTRQAKAHAVEKAKLEAEVAGWKSLADLKDAKGEANRTENNNLRAQIARQKEDYIKAKLLIESLRAQLAEKSNEDPKA